MDARFLWQPHCNNKGFMYNPIKFIAMFYCNWTTDKKKPLVTKLLLRSSYRRGRRCDVNYDQFLSFGQVILKGTHRQPDSGERRWFPKKPISAFNLIARIVLEYSPFVIFVRLVKSCSRIAVSVTINKKGQALVCLAFCNLFELTVYFTESLDVGRIFSAVPL